MGMRHRERAALVLRVRPTATPMPHRRLRGLREPAASAHGTPRGVRASVMLTPKPRALVSLVALVFVSLRAAPATATSCVDAGYQPVDPVYSVDPPTPCLSVRALPGSCGGHPTLELRSACAVPVNLPSDFTCRSLEKGSVACGDLAPGIEAIAHPETVNGGDRVEASYEALLDGRPITIRASYGLRYEQGPNFDPNADYGPCAVRAPGGPTRWSSAIAGAGLAIVGVAARRRRRR